jgi:hypothetical protein
MPTRKSKSQKLPVATAWPDDSISDADFARWVETHSLEKLIRTAERVPIKLSRQPPAGKAKPKKGKAEHPRLTLRISREDLEVTRRIARDKGVSYTALLRSWIREGLKRERRRAAG